MTKVVRYYFDTISPYAWLAFRRVQALALKNSAQFVPVPVLFAALLNAHGQLGPAEIPAKREYIFLDVARRAALNGVSLQCPPSHPFNPLLSLRIASSPMPSEKHRISFIGEVMDSCWIQGKDISDESVLSQIASSCDLDGPQLIQTAKTDQSVKDRLKQQTDEAIALGIFGVPTTVVEGKLHWGSDLDTLSHVEHHLNGSMPTLSTHALDKWKKLQPTARRLKK